MLLSGLVNLFGGGVYLMNLFMFRMFYECGFEVLLC